MSRAYPQSRPSLARCHVAAGREDGVLRAVLAVGGTVWMRCVGHSMSPTIRSGEAVLLSGMCDQLRPRDVVLVALGSRLVLHRALEIGPSSVVTKGDGCATGDGPVQLSNVLGVAKAVRRRGIIVPLRLTTQLGLPACLAYLAQAWFSHMRVAFASVHSRFRSRGERRMAPAAVTKSRRHDRSSGHRLRVPS